MKSNNPIPETQGKYSNRSLVRTVVFQLLYQEDLNPGAADKFLESILDEELPEHKPIRDFAKMLIQKTRQHLTEIDKHIESLSHNWTISRMSITDRNILRLAVCELKYCDTPRPVVINEAIELAKKFGTKDSASFINGVLDKS
ncbi:MAG: transcription antitermination factor NusB [Thermoguttaceae bacterium]